ncbi:MAG: sigma-70 family RNA polymerase sigma factor [Phycisphaerae bacterium]|nr:sigma-70 family RNA polymerase sigma factor [Phycisphaerae bacterium]
MPASEAELVKQAVMGNTRALTALLERVGPEVRRRIAPTIPSRWRPMVSLEDLMQETYIDAFLDVHTFHMRGDNSFSAWLMTIARRNLVDAVRMLEADKRGQGARQLDAGPNAEDLTALEERLALTRTTPSRHVARSENRRLLERALEQLPETYRTVISLYDLQGKSVKEVAAVLQRSPGAVFMLRSRAHRLLSANLGTASLYLSDTA